MLRRSLASAALRPLTAVAHGRHSCARRLSTARGDVSIALPKFLVTTVKTEQVGDKVTYNSSSLESSELPVFLVDVKYEDEASVAAEWVKTNDQGKGKKWTGDKGLGEFSGTVVSQVELSALATANPSLALTLAHSPSPSPRPKPNPNLSPRLAPAAAQPHTSRSWPVTICGTNLLVRSGVYRAILWH